MKKYRMTCMIVIVIALISFCILPWVSKAIAGGCCKWADIPSVTMKLPVHAKPQHICAKDEKGKTSDHKCMKEKGQCCENSENVVLGFGDLEKYHGHVCPGIALGYRATQVALAQLYPGEVPPRGDQFVVISIPRACPAEAISYLTGARYGKGSEGAFNGNLAFDKTIGDSCYIFASMKTGKAVKVTTVFQYSKEMEALKAKKDTDPEANARYEAMSRSEIIRILTAPEKDVFTVTPMKDFSWKEYKEKYLK